MQSNTAHSNLSEYVSFLISVFGETIVKAKLDKILKDQSSSDEAVKKEMLNEAFSFLSPFVVKQQNINNILDLDTNHTVTSHQSVKPDTAARDDIHGLTHQDVHETNPNDWLDRISGHKIHEQTIQINPNF